MSKLDDLIQELCPNGVEYRTFDEVLKYEQPSKYIVKSTDYKDEYNIPVLTAGQTFILGYTDEKDGIYNASMYNPVIIFDDFTGAFKWVDFPFKVKSSAMKILKADSITTLRYVYHVMGFINFSSDEHKRLWISIYSLFRFPMPPLEIQRKIVHILDSFTLLTAELTAELTAREKQYGYYRDTLLSFDDTVKEVKLKDIANFRNGKGHEKEIVEDGKYIVVNSKFISTNGNVCKYSDTQIAPLFIDDILMVMSDLPNGRALAKCFLVDRDDTYTLNQRICALHIKNNEDVNVRYLYYFLSRNKQLLKYDNGVDQTNLRKDDILEVQVALPKLEKQKRIADILDQFDVLCNNISEGLPAEIEARQKQYEYYRDKILTFREI